MENGKPPQQEDEIVFEDLTIDEIDSYTGRAGSQVTLLTPTPSEYGGLQREPTRFPSRPVTAKSISRPWTAGAVTPSHSQELPGPSST